MQTLWKKNGKTNPAMLEFTAGKDRVLDKRIAGPDILASIAHVLMLQESGLIESIEAEKLTHELRNLYKLAMEPDFAIPVEFEDVHSWIEAMLTAKLGLTGKKVHAARSRNDQVNTALRIYFRAEAEEIALLCRELALLLLKKGKKNANLLMPGYTHMQVAMPSSFGLWYGAYAESIADDLLMLHAAYRYLNQNPLGSGAGFGSGFKINRETTTALLGFEQLCINSVYAQMTRGKTEKILASSLAAIASTLSRMAEDVCLWLGENFRFFILPVHLSTGSSIMPHKMNPDAFELIRAKCNKIQALPVEIGFISANLPSGYHRDMQLTKEGIFEAIDMLKECLKIGILMMDSLAVRKDITKEAIYDNMFSVEAVRELVCKGIPFREAYTEVAKSIHENGISRPQELTHTHTGSIGNPAFDQINKKLNSHLGLFDFQQAGDALKQLLAE